MTAHRMHRKKAIHMKMRHSWKLRRIFDSVQATIDKVRARTT
jgi:hypothetical protein